MLGPYVTAFTRLEAVNARGRLHSGILTGVGVTSHATTAAVAIGAGAFVLLLGALAAGGAGGT